MPEIFNKNIIQNNFSRHAKNYQEQAKIQQYAAQKISQLAEKYLHKNCQILDLGSGSSFISQELNNDEISIFELDLSLDMLLNFSDKNITKVKGDFENLPFKEESFDIVISSFSLQWMSDFSLNFAKISKLLNKNGKFIFALPDAKSFQNLRQQNIFNFIDLPESKIIAKSAEDNFNNIYFAQEEKNEYFASGTDFLRSIKNIGANYQITKPKIINKSKLDEFNRFCLKNCGDKNNISASWFISYFIFEKK